MQAGLFYQQKRWWFFMLLLVSIFFSLNDIPKNIGGFFKERSCLFATTLFSSTLCPPATCIVSTNFLNCWRLIFKIFIMNTSLCVTGKKEGTTRIDNFLLGYSYHLQVSHYCNCTCFMFYEWCVLSPFLHCIIKSSQHKEKRSICIKRMFTCARSYRVTC